LCIQSGQRCSGLPDSWSQKMHGGGMDGSIRAPTGEESASRKKS